MTVGFDEAVRKEFLSRNQELRPGCRGPGQDRLRQDPAGLLPAPQGRPGLLRVGAVPLAVPPTELTDDPMADPIGPETRAETEPRFPTSNHGDHP